VNGTNQKGNAADMVFVTMGNEKGFDFGSVIFQMGVVGDDIIDPWQGRFWEANPGID